MWSHYRFRVHEIIASNCCHKLTCDDAMEPSLDLQSEGHDELTTLVSAARPLCLFFLWTVKASPGGGGKGLEETFFALVWGEGVDMRNNTDTVQCYIRP